VTHCRKPRYNINTHLICQYKLHSFYQYPNLRGSRDPTKHCLHENIREPKTVFYRFSDKIVVIYPNRYLFLNGELSDCDIFGYLKVK
jgi:hypothetical protein